MMGRHFLTLDGMRGVAALAVVEHHWAVPAGIPKAPAAYLAVDLFFALSGFVLAHSYARRLEAGMGVIAFMKLRLIRLGPLHLAGVAIMAAAGLERLAGGRDPAVGSHVPAGVERLVA